MSTAVKETVVKGGVIVTEAETGDLVEVRTAKGVSKSSAESRAALKEIAKRRADVLKELADR